MFDLKIIEKFYASLPAKVDNARNVLGRPLTYTEKILFSHLDSASSASNVKRGSSYNDFNPDRVAMQDATAQMALLQFINERLYTPKSRLVIIIIIILFQENSRWFSYSTVYNTIIIIFT